MSEMKRTSISAGRLIYSLLMGDADVAASVTKVYPVVEPMEAKCPYIVYRRSSLSSSPQKYGQLGADAINVIVTCFTQDYDSGVALAEKVRSVLDFCNTELDGQRMRSCYLTDASEGVEGDAYMQNLVFTIKI